jgi:hypothetical protein
MTAIVVRLSEKFRKTLPACKNTLQGTYKHFEDLGDDSIGIGFGGLHPEAQQSLEFTNKSDGSSQMVGEFLIKYPTTDFSWNASGCNWKRNDLEAHVISTKNGTTSDDEAPPSKKQKKANGD